MLSVGAHLQARHRKLFGGARLILLDDDVAGGGAMKPPLAERDHVERHHAAEHAPPRQAVAQHGCVADAVLQADDDDIGRRVPRNDVGHRDGIGALDRHQHHGGIAE